MAHPKFTVKQMATAMRVALAVSGHAKPSIIVGQPGGGKTEWCGNTLPGIVADLKGCSADDVYVHEVECAGRDPEAICGLTLPGKNADGEIVSKNSRSPLIDEVNELAAQYPWVILLLDEVLQANADLMSALAPLLNRKQRRLGRWKLADNVIVVGTGNRVCDKANSKKMPAQVQDRVTVRELQFSAPLWAEYCRSIGVNALIIEAGLAFADDPEFFALSVPAEDRAYCTPRGMVDAAAEVDAWFMTEEFEGTIPPLLEKMIACHIGEVAASKITGFVAQAGEVPTAAEIMADPEGCKVPESTGFQLLAGQVAVSAAVDESTAEKALTYLLRLRPDLKVSLSTKFAVRCSRAGWHLSSTNYQQFISEYADYIPLAY